MASPPRVAGPDGMTMIREPPANPLRTRDPRSNGVGLARRATNDVGITGLDRPRPAASESSTEDEAWPRPYMRPNVDGCGRTGWDVEDRGTAEGDGRLNLNDVGARPCLARARSRQHCHFTEQPGWKGQIAFLANFWRIYPATTDKISHANRNSLTILRFFAIYLLAQRLHHHTHKLILPTGAQYDSFSLQNHTCLVRRAGGGLHRNCLRRGRGAQLCG